MKTKTLK